MPGYISFRAVRWGLVKARLAALLRAALSPFRTLAFYALLLCAGIIISAVYQIGGSHRWQMDDYSNEAYLSGFFGVEQGNGGAFRWSKPSATLAVPGIGAFNGVMRLRLYGDDWGDPPRSVTLGVNSTTLGSFQLQPGWHDYEFPVTRSMMLPGDLRLHLRMPEAQIPAGRRGPEDTRTLGAPVQEIALARTDGWVLPPVSILLITLAICALVFLHAVYSGLAARPAFWLAACILLAWSATLLVWRLQLAIAAQGILLALVVGALASLALRPALGALFRRGGVVLLPREWAWLAHIFVLGVVFKAAGLLDPMFSPIDHYARLHRLMEFGANPLYFLQHFLDADRASYYAGQLGFSTVVPYSPLFYVAFSPLNWLVDDPDARLQALNLVCSILEASNAFLLFYAAKRAWGSGLAGIWAGAVFVALPLSNLLFSDGGYPGIFATWLLTLLIAALVYAYPRLHKARVWIPMAVLLGLALLAHTANGLLIGATLVVFLALVWVADRARFGPVLRWAVAGVAISFLAFYMAVAQMMLDLLPQIMGKFQSGGATGTATGTGVGAGQKPYLNNFWEQIEVHFRVWPVLLAACALWLCVRRIPMAGRTDLTSPAVSTPDGDGLAARGLTLWLLASAAIFGLFEVAGVWINLLQKQMIYIIPALALLAGLALGWLWRRGRLAQLLCIALWLVLFSTSLVVWVDRTVRYVLPPGSG